MTNINALKQQAEILLDKLTSGKRYLLGELNVRLSEARTNHPDDTVIQAVAHVVERLHQKSPEGIISQGELENIYQELVGLNAGGTRFRHVLGDLLMSDAPIKTSANEDHIKGMRDNPDDGEIQYDSDKEVQTGFESLFGLGSDPYNPHQASAAKDKVARELVSIGYDKHRVRLAGGNSRFLIFAADLDTYRGAVRVFIPAEASGETFPSIFVAGHHFEQLNKTSLGEYLEEAVLRNTRPVEVRNILATLDAATGNVQKHASDEDIEQLTSKLPEKDEGFSGHGAFVDMPNIESIPDVQIPEVPLPELLKPIASDMEESILEATVGYPHTTVRLAKRMLSAEFNDMGFKGTQFRIASPMSDGFICEAVLNTLRGKVVVEIPIEMKNNIPLMPSVFAKDDFIAEFNQANITNFITKEARVESVAVRNDNSLLSMSLYELKDIIVRSASTGDFTTCDEVLEIVAYKFDENTYRSTVMDYQKVLEGVCATKETIKQSFEDSDQFIKTPNSLYPIHKKLGRPAHDLVRDEGGEYHLKSTYYARQQTDEEGAFFSTAKALVGD